MDKKSCMMRRIGYEKNIYNYLRCGNDLIDLVLSGGRSSSPHPDAYALIADDSKIILSSPDGTEIIRTLDGMQAPLWELIFTPDRSMLAATDGKEIWIWQAGDGKLMYVGKPAC